MRTTITLLLAIISGISFSQEKPGSKLESAAEISINSNGIASIPAFSLGKPAVIASVNLAKNKFSFDPVLAYSLDMKPWFIDCWLHYKIADRPKYELRAGFNFSNFFSSFKLENETIHKSERYFAFEMAATYKFTSSSSLSFMYWRDMGQEPGTISGHFFNLVADRSYIKVGKRTAISVNVQLFYISYDGDNDGLFISPKISSSAINFPFTLYFQATQAISSNVLPWPGFKWNVGLAYAF